MIYDIPRPKKPQVLPKVLSFNEVKQILAVTENFKHRMILKTIYGMGLRVSEVVNLKINEIDSERMLAEKIDTMEVQVQNAQRDVSRGFIGSFYYFSNLVVDRDTLKSTMRVDTLLNLTKEHRVAAFANAKVNAESMATSVKFAKEDVYYRNLSMYSYQVEYYNKFTFSLACLLFFFIGAPLGSIIRKGGIGIPLVITVAFFTFYFMLSAFGKNLAKTGQVSAFVGVWLATFVLIPICVVLTYKATVDSSIMSAETYIKLFKKVQTKISSIFKLKK